MSSLASIPRESIKTRTPYWSIPTTASWMPFLGVRDTRGERSEQRDGSRPTRRLHADRSLHPDLIGASARLYPYPGNSPLIVRHVTLLAAGEAAPCTGVLRRGPGLAGEWRR